MTEKTYYEILPWFSLGPFQIEAKVAENVGTCTSENGVHLSKDKCVANPNSNCIPDCNPGEYYSVDHTCISKTEDAYCCRAMTKECLACSAGYGDDVDSYCNNHPDSVGCYVSVKQPTFRS